MSAIGLSDYAFGAQDLSSYEDKTVVWVWLGGGPTQFETFHAPNDTVPTIGGTPRISSMSNTSSLATSG